MNCTAEGTLITALLVTDYDSGIDTANLILSPEDFIDSRMRQIFRCLIAMREKGHPIDALHLHEGLVADGVEADYAAALVADSFDGAPIRGQVDRYAKEVKAQAIARQTAKAVEVANKRISEGENIEWAKKELIADIEEIDTHKKTSTDQRIGELANPVLNAIADRLAGDDSKRGLRTGLEGLDACTTGINAGELWVCGAMPGRGKSALAIQIADNLAGNGFPVYFLSLEMSKAQIMMRVLKARFGSHVVENPGERWKDLQQYAADLQTLPLYVNDEASHEISELTAQARIRIARSGIKLVIVDHLQLIRGPGRDRREKIGDATNALRCLAKDTGVPVLALSQLRRPDDINDRPTMMELKESGDIESHAHVVALIYAPIDDEGRFMGREEIIIGKQREGPTGSIPVYFDRARTKFFPRVEA